MGRRLGLLACVGLLAVAAPRDAAADSCISYLPANTGFPVVMLANGDADITITKPNTPDNHFTTKFQQQVTFRSPVDEATLVFGPDAPTLFQSCDGNFPSAKSEHVDHGDVFDATTTVTSNGFVITVTEKGRNHTFANDGNCPVPQCVSDVITYTDTWTYDLGTGSYTLTYTSRRDFESQFGDQHTVSHSTASGTVTGQMIIPILTRLVIAVVNPADAQRLEPLAPYNGSRSRLKIRVGCVDPAGAPVNCAWQIRASRPFTGNDLEVDTGHPNIAAGHGARPSVGQLLNNGLSLTTLPDDIYAEGKTAVTFDYIASEIAGTVEFTGECDHGLCQPATLRLRAEIRSLVDVRDTPNLWLLADEIHGQPNGYAKPEMREALARIARCWIAAPVCIIPFAQPDPVFGINDRLYLTDVSLRYGGRYDLKPIGLPRSVWHNRPNEKDGHAAHHEGKVVDMRMYQTADPDGNPRSPRTNLYFSENARKYLEALFLMEGFIFDVKKESSANGTADHWHAHYMRSVTVRPGVVTAHVVARETADDAEASCAVPSSVTAQVAFDASRGLYRYTYTVSHSAAATRPLQLFRLDATGPTTSISMPAQWFHGDLRAAPTERGIGWVGLSAGALQPGQSGEFVIDSPAPPSPIGYDLQMGADPADDPESDTGTDDPCVAEAGTVQGPNSVAVAYLAEGATGSFFETRIALFNPNASPTSATLRFLKETTETVTQVVTLPAHARRTIIASQIAGLESANFSTVVTSGSLVVVDRTMSWDASGYGSHAETAISAPSAVWYVAEGSTSDVFSLFYLLQNPNDDAATATVRYLRSSGLAPVEKTYALPAHSRTTIAVDAEGPEVNNTDVSAVVNATAPIIVERAMYRSSPTQTFAAGHESAGVTEPSTHWFLAEGATGPFFDMFILIANPSASEAHVAVDYLLSTGETLSKTYDVGANSRFTIPVDSEELPAGSGIHPLVNVAVSSRLTSTNDVPIIVERAMWWPSPELTSDFWREAHNSAGVTATGTRWALAEGEVGGAQSAETYILIANTSAFAGAARLTLYCEDGTTAERTITLLPASRTSVNVSLDVPEVAGKRFGATIESLGATPPQIVVERAMYTSPGGIIWAAGTDAVATRLP